MKKKLQLVLVPKNYKINALLGYSDKSKLFIRPYHYEYSEKDLEITMSSYFHLYAISDEKPKKDDYVICAGADEKEPLSVLKYTGKELGISKIVITTDESVGYTDHKISPISNFCSYPTFTNDFINTYIEKYNSGNIITEIEVEYEEFYNFNIGDKLEVIRDLYKLPKGSFITVKSFNHRNDLNLLEFEEDDEHNQGIQIGHLKHNIISELKTNSDNTVDVSLIDEEYICRICSSTSTISKGLMNIHDIQTLDYTKEFITKFINCYKCSNCGHSWIPKRKLALDKLDKEVTDLLAKETKESLTERLNGKRSKMYTQQEVDDLLDRQAAETTAQLLKNHYTKEKVVGLLKSMYAEFATYPTMNLDLRDNWINKNL